MRNRMRHIIEIDFDYDVLAIQDNEETALITYEEEGTDEACIELIALN